MEFFPNFSQFPEYVRTELNRRTHKQIEVSKLNAWIRVSSAVKDGIHNGLSLISNPDYQLFSAVSGDASIYGAQSLAGTIGTDWSGTPVNSQTGIGYKPKPNITSIEVDEGMGALSRKASFSITAYTVDQLDELCKYFLEPGFTVFLEWGWNTKESVAQLVHLDEVIKNDSIDMVSKFQSFDNVNIARHASLGCYDNYLGFITGGGIDMEGDHWVISVSCTGFTELPAYLMVTDNTQPANTPIDDTTVVDDNSAMNFLDKDMDILSNNPLGKKRFMMMFNDLPSTRKTISVKNMVNNPSMTDIGNFINFDLTVRNLCNERVDGVRRVGSGLFGLFGLLNSNSTVKTGESDDTTKVSFEGGTKLVGDERFIRFGTLMDIINANGIDSITVGKTNVATKVDVSNTIIAAFKRIFSHDKKKLFIPNKNTPLFSIEFAAHSAGKQSNFSTTKDYSIRTNKTGVHNFFPATVDYRGGMHKKFQYGYLQNLYVNFDFAMDVLDTKNLTMKDALYQILNGMSSAAGGLWDFQIQETPVETANTNGAASKTDTVLTVIDLNCASNTRDEPHLFYALGDSSIFMNAALDMDISGAKMNQIIGNRLAASTGKTINSSQPSMKGNLFSTSATDMVLNSIKYTPNTEKDATPFNEKDWESAIKANFRSFLNDVGIYPKVEIPTGWGPTKDATIMDNFYIACFNSQTIFDALKNNNDIVTITNDGGVSPLLPINFTFTIHGISGIQRGSKFIVHGLPSKYSTDGFFQVTSVKHIIDGMLWKTEVTGGFRIQRKGKSGSIKAGNVTNSGYADINAVTAMENKDRVSIAESTNMNMSPAAKRIGLEGNPVVEIKAADSLFKTLSNKISSKK